MLTFEEASHIYRWNGEIVPSVNQVLRFGGLIQDYMGVDEAVLMYARDRGIAVDMAITLYHAGMLDESSLDPVIKPYFEAYLSFLHQEKPKFLHAKRRLYSEALGYAGENDVEFEWRGHTVVDIKVTARLYPSVAFQLAGYQGLTGAERRVGLLLKKDGKFQIKEYQDEDDWMVFSMALNAFKEFNHDPVQSHVS